MYEAEIGSELTAKPYWRFMNNLTSLNLTLGVLKDYKMAGYLHNDNNIWISDLQKIWDERYKVEDNVDRCVCGVVIYHKFCIVNPDDEKTPALIVGSSCMENWGIRINCLTCKTETTISKIKKGMCRVCKKKEKECKICHTNMKQIKYPQHRVCFYCCKYLKICYCCGVSVPKRNDGDYWVYCWDCKTNLKIV